MLSLERLKQVLDYDAESGIFTWKIIRRRGMKAGDKAGSLNYLGYMQTKIDGVSYRMHRLAWFYHYGSWPYQELDHIDGDRANNRISNLREATRAQNCQNKVSPTRTEKLPRGVGAHSGAYRARINVNGKQIFLGRFHSVEAAHAAYCKAAHELHGEFARVA